MISIIYVPVGGVLLVALLAAASLPGTSQAQDAAAATVHLNIRAGPGTQHPVTGVIPPQGQVTKERCRGRWCEVRYKDMRGWVYSEFLEAVAAEEPEEQDAVATEPQSDASRKSARPDKAEPIVIYAPPGEGGGAATGTVGGGTLLGGPAERR